MSCYHPLNGYISGINESTGKNKIKILPQFSYNSFRMCNIKESDLIKIPCGKCIGCRLDYSRQWADRCMCEAQYNEHNIFLTLTYDDNHLPDCREHSSIHSLNKRDLQLFMKRLRKKFSDQQIRFYACGEYGPKNMRPHYHLILFGLNIEDKKVLKVRNGYIYYTSDTLNKLWPYGYHSFSDVSWDTCAYVARYVLKKQKGKGAVVYEELDYEPEFTLMSRKPGIGKQFYEDHNDIVVKDYYIPSGEGHKTIRSNKYYDKLFDIDYPNTLEFIKEDRKISALQSEWLKSCLSSQDPDDRRKSEEETKLAQIKALKREEV